MNFLIAFLGLTYFLALVFWLRYLYRHSLSRSADRTYTYKRIADLAIYVPMGLQAAFLFPYTVIQLFPQGVKTARLFDILVLGNRDAGFPELYPIKIIVIGSLMIGISYTLLKAISLLNDRIGEMLLRTLLFALTLFILKATVENIYYSLRIGLVKKVSISYDHDFAWLFGLLLAIVILTISRARESAAYSLSKYLSLTGRILLFYCCIVLLIGLPRMIFLVFEALFL